MSKVIPFPKATFTEVRPEQPTVSNLVETTPEKLYDLALSEVAVIIDNLEHFEVPEKPSSEELENLYKILIQPLNNYVWYLQRFKHELEKSVNLELVRKTVKLGQLDKTFEDNIIEAKFTDSVAVNINNLMNRFAKLHSELDISIHNSIANNLIEIRELVNELLLIVVSIVSELSKHVDASINVSPKKL